jgi:hypothetical protein
MTTMERIFKVYFWRLELCGVQSGVGGLASDHRGH